jgi:hypothetical protein
MFTIFPPSKCLSSFQLYKERFCALPKKTQITLLIAAGSLIASIFVFSLVSVLTAPKTFRKASSVVGRKALKAIVAENYSGANPESVYKTAKALDVDGKFSIIDFNNPDLCGNAAGNNACLYVAYDSSGKRLLSLYLDPTVVKNRSLFQVSDQQKDGFPCLKISQPNDVDLPTTDAVQIYDYCYSAGTRAFIRIVDGLEKPVLVPSPVPAKTPVPKHSKKKGSAPNSTPTPTPTPVGSPS